MYKRKSPRRYRKRRKSLFQGLGKKMKMLPTILIIAMVIVCSIGIIRYVDRMAPSWAATEAVKNAQRIREAELKIEREREYTQVYTKYIDIAFGVVVFGGAGMVIVGLGYTIHKRLESSNRAKDGMFALKWVVKDGVNYLINPNLATQSIAAITDENLGNREHQQQRQMQVLQNQGRAQLAQAMSNQPTKYVAQAKLLAGAYDKQPRLPDYHSVEEEPEEITLYPQLTLNDAIKQSTKESWILGHCLTDNTTCTFALGDVIHLAIVGGSGVGKTSYTAFHMMYMALKNGFKVIALDAKNGIDWQKFSGVIEATKTNKAMFPHQLESIFNEFRRRMNLVKEAGVNRIDEMRNPPQKILIILEEFSTLINEFDSKKTDKTLVENIYKMIDIMLKQGRVAGMHFCVIDQDNNTWTSTMKKMLRGLLIYNLGGYGSASFTPQERIPVDERGQFAYKGKAYNSWLVADKIDSMMGAITLPKTDYKLLPVIEDDKPSYDISLVAPNTSTDTKQLKMAKTYKNTASLLPQVQSASASAGVNVSANTNSSTEVYRKIIDDALANKIGVLEGKPKSKYEKKLVYNIWLITQDKTKVCEVCWGSKNSSRWKWLNEIIEEYEEKNHG